MTDHADTEGDLRFRRWTEHYRRANRLETSDQYIAWVLWSSREPNGQCDLTAARLAEQAGCSVRTVGRSLKRLESVHLIRRWGRVVHVLLPEGAPDLSSLPHAGHRKRA